MKRMLFGVGLLLSGTIGFTGWGIAATQTVQPGARSTVIGCLSGADWLGLLFFAVMAAAGLVISWMESHKKE